MKRSIARRIVLPLTFSLIVALGAGVGLLELGLRHFYWIIPLEVCASDDILGNYYCAPYFEYDKPIRIAYRYRPNMHVEGWWDPADPRLVNAGKATAPSDRSDAFWYVFETDEMGFPNSERSWRQSYDVIVTGDSFVTRTVPRSWIDLLRKQTGKSVLTLGASSWGTLNEVEAVKMYGLDKKPEWIILLYFEGNDLLNVAQYLKKQESGLDWREYDLQGVPIWRRLFTWHLLRHYLLERVDDTPPDRYRYPVSASTEAGMIDTVFMDSHLLPLSANYETVARSDEFAHLTAALLELHQLAARQEARLLLVYVPSKEHVYWSRIWDPVDVNNILERSVTVRLSQGDHGALQWQPQYLSYEMFQANHDDQERVFEDFARQTGIEFLNLTPILWQTTIAQGELYHYADPHWNQAGNQLVADILTDYLLGAGK